MQIYKKLTICCAFRALYIYLEEIWEMQIPVVMPKHMKLNSFMSLDPEQLHVFVQKQGNNQNARSEFIWSKSFYLVEHGHLEKVLNCKYLRGKKIYLTTSQTDFPFITCRKLGFAKVFFNKRQLAPRKAPKFTNYSHHWVNYNSIFTQGWGTHQRMDVLLRIVEAKIRMNIYGCSLSQLL